MYVYLSSNDWMMYMETEFNSAGINIYIFPLIFLYSNKTLETPTLHARKYSFHQYVNIFYIEHTCTPVHST